VEKSKHPTYPVGWHRPVKTGPDRKTDSTALVGSTGAPTQAHRPVESRPSQHEKTTEAELLRGYSRQCVRCGIRRRHTDLFICLDDPMRLLEQAAVEPLDYAEQRSELVRRFHWFGQWPK
jgi:hypothetical protein